MKTVITIILGVMLCLFAISLASAQCWQTIYETDFSTDPGWTTNNPAYFYWDSATATYSACQTNISGGGYFAGYDAGYDGGSILLEFEIIVESEQYCSDLSFGMFDSDFVTDRESYFRLSFTHNDQGLHAFLNWCNADSTCGDAYDWPAQWALDTWYRVSLEYDDDNNTMTVDIRYIDGTPFTTYTATGVGPFNSDMGNVGSSNVREGTFGCPENVSTCGRFDNVKYSLEASDLVQLTTLGGYTARWSFDGTRIVFTSIRDSGNHEIYSMSACGTNQTRLTFHAAYDKLASWHPSGESIVFVSTRNGNHDIWTMNADGSNKVLFIEHSAWDDAPMWSPGGTKLAFESSRDGDWEVYTVNSDSTAVTQLTFNNVVDGCPSWSTAGDRICFVSFRDGHSQVYVMNSDGTDQTNISNNSYSDDWPSWLPDGRIAFMSNRDGNDEIYVMNSDGSCQTNLTNRSADDGQPHASPNGDWLLFHSDRDGLRNVYKMRISGGQAMPVHLDIKPGSCPNPLNIKHGRMDGGSTMAAGGGGKRVKKAVLPVAILGTAEFDVAQIDATTVVLEGVPALRWNYEDVATPVAEDAGECECNTDGPDGFVDMTLKFNRAEIIAALGEVYDGDVIPLTISGQLIDGTPFEGVDCVIIRAGGNAAPANDDQPETSDPAIASVNNYPNPFNPRTTISFSLPVASHVSLEIYNVMGQRVTTVADGFYEAGVHACEWDGSAVASGVYFYRIETQEFVETKKMMLLK